MFFAWIRGQILRSGLWRLGLTWPPFKINLHVALCLALQALIAHGRKPPLRMAIIFKTPILHRLVKTLAHVVQDDPRFFVARHGKPDIIGTTIGGQVRTPAGIAKVAEIAQLRF